MSSSCTYNAGGEIKPFHELQNALIAGKRIRLEFHEIMFRPEEYWHFDKEAGEYVCTLLGREYLRCQPSRFAARVQGDISGAVAAEIVE